MSSLSDATDAALAAERADLAQQAVDAQATLADVRAQLATITADDEAQKALVAELQAQLLDQHDLTAWTKAGPALNIPGDLVGKGDSRTIYSLPEDTSQVAAQVAAIPSGTANPYWLLWLGGSDASHVVDSPTYRDFWLRGTDQGHQYQSAQVRYTRNALLSDLLFTGIPGSGTTPPGETHGAPYFFHSDNAHTKDCVFDGRVDGKGPGIAATLIGHWACDSVTHDNIRLLYGANGFGAAHSGGTHGAITYNGPEIGWCNAGFNFEKLDTDAQGTVIEIVDPNIHDLARTYWGQLSTANLKASAVVNIRFEDVTLPASGVPWRLYGTAANGGTNGQKASDLHVWNGGVDVTSRALNIVRF